MGNYTTNLGLYNTDMNTDGNDTFDFQRDLNDNNDKIDSAIGKLSTLTTTDKSSLVNAIIEIVTNLGGKTSKSLDDLNAVGQAIIDKKVEVEALLAQNGYAKFSWKENNVISILIQWGYSNYSESSAGTKQIIYPIAFTTVYNVINSSTGHSSASFSTTTATTHRVCHFTYQSATGDVANTSFTLQATNNFYWFAIGT